MARIRTIKPEFWTDSFMVQIPHMARLLYIALWTVADDHGFIKDEPERIAMEVMPKENPMDIDDYIQLFIASERIESYVTPQGETYLRIAKWENHQRVDKPSISRIAREGSKKFAIPTETRRKVALKYGCQPGDEKEAECFYCGAPGKIHWFRLNNGRPSQWVTFPDLELDHVEPEINGGKATCENIVLACRNCNRSKGTKHWHESICTEKGIDIPILLANTREHSYQERNGKEGKVKEKKGIAPVKKPDAIVVNPDSELQERIKEAFLSRNGNNFTDWPKEIQAIKGIIKKARDRSPEDPDGLIRQQLNTFWKKKAAGEKYWKDIPFLPSKLNCAANWDSLLETTRADSEPNIVAQLLGVEM